jgi:CheY-like chemotaxis protein
MSGAGRGSRILVVDDNEEAAEALAMWLEMLGHEVTLATSAEAAIARARAARPDAMVCDIGLPGMNGYELARAIRADTSLAEVRLIALSGYTHARDRAEADEAGFDVFLGKPVDPEKLEQLLGAGR